VYFLPTPPYFWLLFGLFASITSGLAFQANLKQLVNEWSKTRSSRIIASLQGMPLQLPFIGMCFGICIFLASGLEIFGFPSNLSYLISVMLTVFIGGLVWSQLGNLLIQLEQGGSKALDLDSFN
jgi:hypothetical protein